MRFDNENTRRSGTSDPAALFTTEFGSPVPWRRPGHFHQSQTPKAHSIRPTPRLIVATSLVVTPPNLPSHKTLSKNPQGGLRTCLISSPPPTPPLSSSHNPRMSRRTTLRPCLKQHSTDPEPSAAQQQPPPPQSPFPFATSSSVLGPRVHFPPAPGLCQTYLAHPASIYDRAPIVVPPNVCALPARNERTYTPSGESLSCSAKKRRSASARATAHGATLHPHAFAESAQTQAHQAQAYATASDPAGRMMPALVPDLSSSESDESDVNSTPPIPNHYVSMGHPPISIVDGTSDAALSFLPHANEREKPRKERGHRSSSRSLSSPRSVRTSEFAVPELDGCLGGF